MRGEHFCEACKTNEKEKNIVEKIEDDLWKNILQGGYDF